MHDPMDQRAYVVGAVVGLLLKVAILVVLVLGAFRLVSAIFETRRLVELLVAQASRCR